MINIDKHRKQKLKQTEEHLKTLGLTKCSKCGIWTPKDCIKNNNCIECTNERI